MLNFNFFFAGLDANHGNVKLKLSNDIIITASEISQINNNVVPSWMQSLTEAKRKGLNQRFFIRDKSGNHFEGIFQGVHNMDGVRNHHDSTATPKTAGINFSTGSLRAENFAIYTRPVCNPWKCLGINSYPKKNKIYVMMSNHEIYGSAMGVKPVVNERVGNSRNTRV